MALLRLFLTRVVSGVALHATVTVRAGRRAWAGSGEISRCDSGLAVIVNTSAAITTATNSAAFSSAFTLLLWAEKQGCSPASQTRPQKAPRMAAAKRGRKGIGESSARRAALTNDRATPALGEARQKRETLPRIPRPTTKAGSGVGAGFVARTILRQATGTGRSGHARRGDPHTQGRRRCRLIGEHANDQPVARALSR